MQPNQPVNILIAEDDDDHYFLAEKILKSSPILTYMHRAVDGEDLMKYLLHKGEYSNPRSSPRPNLIILDINMPRKDGWEVLKEIKSNPNLRQIPIVVLTTSDVEEDKIRGYDLGANSYVRKPIDYKKWVETMHMINRYWFETVELPEGAVKK